MHSIVTTFRGAVIKVEVANFCAAMDTLIDQDASSQNFITLSKYRSLIHTNVRLRFDQTHASHCLNSQVGIVQ